MRTFQANENYETFRDCLSAVVLEQYIGKSSKERAKRPRRKSMQKHESQPDIEKEDGIVDPAELSEFIEYLSEEVFSSLPSDFQMLSLPPSSVKSDQEALYELPLESSTLTKLLNTIPQNIYDTLVTYFPTPDSSGDDLGEIAHSILSQIINTYLTHISTFKPSSSSPIPGTGACEICLRDWIPLTAHHLIPRSIHAKALKRGWHPASDLNNLAYLCRACHSFVHRMAGNEELAKEWFVIEKVLERDDVQRWAVWVGRVRWKKR